MLGVAPKPEQLLDRLVALSDDPIATKDAKTMTGDNDVTHSSTVYYNKATNPFIAYVDRVYWGAKPAEDLEFWQFASEWKRDHTEYKEWDGNSWDTEKTVKAGKWRDCGSADDGLC